METELDWNRRSPEQIKSGKAALACFLVAGILAWWWLS